MRTACLIIILFTVALTACNSGGPRGDLDRSIAAYDKRDYPEALKLAQVASEQATTTKDSYEAAYMAGMSAYQLNDYASAERWLKEAVRSTDSWTAGEAGVMLGNTQLRLKKPSDAARSFAKAATHLSGADANKARIASANAYREVGDNRAADEQFRLANVPTTVTVNSPPRPTSAPSSTPAPTQPKAPSKAAAPAANSAVKAAAPSAGPFVIQAGAFRDESKAKKRADELRAKSVKIGLGEPRISSKKATDGSKLWVVQIGGFPDRSTADAAVTKLGANGVVVGRAVASS